MQHEKSGLAETSYAETPFSFGVATPTEGIERRLKALRDINTGLLNTSKIALQNILLSEQNELVLTLNDRLNKEKAKIDQMKDLPEYEETKRKKQLTKNLEKDLKDAIQERKELEKKVKNFADQDQKNAFLEARIEEEIKSRNAMEERLNQTKTLDDLKERVSELQRQNEEDQAIIQDENASPSDKEAAGDRVAERNDERAGLQT